MDVRQNVIASFYTASAANVIVLLCDYTN